MRGTVHCIAVFLLLFGSLGLICLYNLAIQTLGKSLSLQPGMLYPGLWPYPPVAMAHERIPFEVRPD